MKSCSTLLIIREMQIKPTMKYPLPQSKWPSSKCLQTINAESYGEKETLLHYWWKCKLVQPPWRPVCQFLSKLNIELPCDPAIPLLGIYPDKTATQKDTCYCVSVVMNLASIHEDVGSIPGHAQWVKDLTLP